MARPPRLPGISYKGPGAYFVTTCTNLRNPFFVDREVVDVTWWHFLQSAELAHVEITAYCFMPDHLHLLAVSTAQGDLNRFMRRAKQTSGYSFKKLMHRQLWQAGYYDRILRSDHDVLTVIAYIVANPIRRGLVESAEEWPHWGAAHYSRDVVLQAIAADLDPWRRR